MAHYVLDSYALLAYFRNEAGGEAVEKLLNDAAGNRHQLYMSIINAGEVYYMACRKDGQEKGTLVWKALQQFPVELIEADLAFVHKAAGLKARYRLSYTDAFAAAPVINKKAILITGDKEFDNLISEPGFKVKYIL